MLYPIYDYYALSNLTLEEIIDDYSNKFYLKYFGRNKLEKIKKKLSKVAAIDAFSVQLRVVPNYVDFCSALNGVLWFFFQSNKTQALATLIAANEWAKRVNDVHHFGSDKEVRDKAIGIFKKYDIYEEMSQEQYEMMTASITETEVSEEEDNEDFNDTSLDEIPDNLSQQEWNDYVLNIPKPLDTPLTEDDLYKLSHYYKEEADAIMADGATEDQTTIKYELLLKKREKTGEMIISENILRNEFRKRFESIAYNEEEDAVDLMIASEMLGKARYVFAKEAKDKNSMLYSKKMVADMYGISYNLILLEEYKRAKNILF